MNDRLLDYAIRIQSIAQAGLQYGKDKYDRERYAELREIAAEMISAKTEISMEKVRDLFCNETGYQTPKIDTRAAVFIDGKFSLFTKTTEPGACPAAGATLTNPLRPTPRRRSGRKQGSPSRHSG